MDDHSSDPVLARLLEPWRPIADDLEWSTPFTTLFRRRPPYDEWFVERLKLTVEPKTGSWSFTTWVDDAEQTG